MALASGYRHTGVTVMVSLAGMPGLCRWVMTIAMRLILGLSARSHMYNPVRTSANR
jgi:hypothetical protein